MLCIVFSLLYIEPEWKQLLEASTKMNRAKIIQIEQLTNAIKKKECESLYILIICKYTIIITATEKELLSVSAERQRELETLQEIVTSLTLQLRERDQQIEELKQSLKGN